MTSNMHVDMTGRASDILVDAEPLTPLEMLADELGDVDPGTVTLKVDARPRWAVVCTLRLDAGRLAAWRRAAKDETRPSGFDDAMFARTILAGQTTEILHDGRRVVDEAGKPVTFFSAHLWKMLKIPAGAPSGATEAVRKFYASDFAASSAADAVLEEAGFGRRAERVDPTVTPSSVSPADVT